MSHQISTAEELLVKEFALKFVEVDKEQSRLVFSNRKAMADSQAQLGIRSIVLRTAEEMAQTFRQKIAQAEAMACVDMLRLPNSGLTLSSDGILGPLTADLPTKGLDFSDIPAAEEFS
ncbi:hypothetical protein V6N13_029612 [Hibiscus sabdariffa]